MWFQNYFASKVPKFSLNRILRYWSYHKRVTAHYLSPNKTWHAQRQNIKIIHTTSNVTPTPLTHTDSLTPLTKKPSLPCSKHGGGEAEAQRRRWSRRRNCGGGSKAQQWPDFKSDRLCRKLIVKLMYDSSLPHHYLSGNFAPVREETPPTTDLLVKGHLPVRTTIHFVLCFLYCIISSNPYRSFIGKFIVCLVIGYSLKLKIFCWKYRK